MRLSSRCSLALMPLTRQIMYMTIPFGLLFGSIIHSFIWIWHAPFKEMLKCNNLSKIWKAWSVFNKRPKSLKIVMKVIILGSCEIHMLNARPKPDKDVKCTGSRQMPDPRAVVTFQMPHPRDWNVSKCPIYVSGGGEGGWSPLELVSPSGHSENSQSS